MVSRDELKGRWHEVKGRLKEQWDQLSEEDFSRIEGGAERLVGAIQQKTGATRREVESFLERCMQDASGMSALTREYIDQAADAMRDGYKRAADSTGEFSKRLGERVSRKPIESLAIALAMGAVVGCMYAMSRRDSTSRSGPVRRG
ncbi:CsbD family protein [Candidatus Laterigemmans baculatus]|uniref:CsbD family protein n=1 Tax=Candidatus Laterigemmans baculatus TaxID=2770505 RepID=UPI0013DB1D50|nr:CsbD family protein [Candidatus Laterigemmans baculatus]